MAGTTKHVQAPRTRNGSASRRPAVPGSRPFRLESKRQLYVLALGAAAVLAVALVAASLLGGRGGGAANGGTVAGASETAQLLAGIPQHGTTLGSPTAPVTVIEYADLQCPYCGEWARNVLPAVVRDYVRPGKVKLELRGLTFVGADSKTALETALGAAPQNRFWNVVDLLYRNQGTENTGWVTDPLLRSVLDAVPGLDVSRALSARGSSAVAAQVSSFARLAALGGVSSTPTFEVVQAGGQPQPLLFDSLTVSSFESALTAAITR
jgi:protein-disulfide isomerase